MARKTILFLLFSAVVLLVYPLSSSAQQFNKNQVFFGVKGLNLSYDTAGASDDELSGFQVGYSRVLEKHFEFRGSYYYLEHDDFSDLTAEGFDLGLVVGLVDPGFKLYGGAGYYSETWENSSSHDFSGLELIGGIGYNWPTVGLDFTIAWRDTSDYEDFVNSYYGIDTDVTAASASLNLGFRF